METKADMETGSLPLCFTSRQVGFQDERIRLDEDIAKEDEWRWAVAQTYFDHRGLVKDHITSYNNFVEKGIHEMFSEAEPFEVLPPDEAIRKKVVVSFGEVELISKPEVEKEDRAIEGRRGPEETAGSEQSGDGAAKGKGKGAIVNWLTNDEAGPSSGANLNVDKDSSGNAMDDDIEEPPKISQEAWGTDDPHNNEDMEEDPGEFSAFSLPRLWKTNLKLLPVEARMRGITYSSPIYVKVIVETTTQEPMPHKSSKHPSSSSSSRWKPVTDKVEYKVLLGRIPVMVKSSLCHLSDCQNSREPLKGDCSFDPGGYFIIKGSEKVIVAQEERTLQRLWVNYKDDTWTASCTTKRRGFSEINWKTHVKLAEHPKIGTGRSEASPLITVSFTGVEALPIGVLFSALGVSSDRDILEMIAYTLDDLEMVQTICPSLSASDRELARALKQWDTQTFARAPSKRDREVALFLVQSKINNKKIADDQGAQNLLKSRFLPHIGFSERSKALFLGYMVRTVVSCFLGRQQATDFDDMKNKRLEFAGEIIGHQFRKIMGQVKNVMKKRLQKHLSKGTKLQGAEKYLDHKVMTRGLKMAFTSGNWMSHEILKNSGVSFDLKRQNPLATLCQLREIRRYVPPTMQKTPAAKPRPPTFSQWGKVCPIDTPEKKNCGLVLSMALTGMASCASPEGPVRKMLADAHVEDLESVKDLASLQLATKVFLNGRWIGSVREREEVGEESGEATRPATRLVNTIRKARRKGLANKTNAYLSEVEVVNDNDRREVHISTDAGRILRPLLIVKETDQTLVLNEEYVVAFQQNIQKNKRFQWLLQQGVVELLGIEEEEKAIVALQGSKDIRRKAKRMKRRGEKPVVFTHAELHPSLILGLSGSLIPFPNHNASERNLYQAHKHCKQAMGVSVTNINSRADTSGMHLFYPQVQLVKTNAYGCLQKPEMYSGQNAIVAIACYTGYNQEDSIIMNQSSLERGMFRTAHYRTFRDEERNDSETFGKQSELEIPGENSARSVEKLDEDGLPSVGLSLRERDVIVGKISKSDSIAGLTTGGRSQRLKVHEGGRVAQAILIQHEEGYKIAKVKLIESRMPEVGDKFSSMHGQKGVIGQVFTQEDLPFTKEGIVPDIIINPHAFPKRQTLGQLFESNQGKTVAKTGQRHFATPFNESSTLESMLDALHNSGYERMGTEIMYNGFTGQPMEAKIFIGPNFYQRLDKMVKDTIRYRSRGQVHPLTRQPLRDRKRRGGVKFGEMERDCLIGHGAAATLQERTFVLSDYHTVHVCKNCEQLANWNADRVPACPHCSKSNNKGTVVVELPYSCKLLVQELMSMGISVRLKTEIS